MILRIFLQVLSSIMARNRMIPLIFSLVFWLGLNSCSTSYAGITIPAEKEFVLGECENGKFRVNLKNTSGLAIKVSAVDKNTGEPTQSFDLTGKGNAQRSISRKEVVLLKNPYNEDVLIKAKLNKGVEGMSYRSLDRQNE